MMRQKSNVAKECEGEKNAYQQIIHIAMMGKAAFFTHVRYFLNSKIVQKKGLFFLLSVLKKAF